MPPERVSTGYTIGHENTPKVLKRKLEFAQTLLDLYHSGKDEKRSKEAAPTPNQNQDPVSHVGNVIIR